MQLPYDTQPVRRIPLPQLGRQHVGRLEVGGAERDPRMFDDPAQHINRAALTNLLGQPSGDLLLGSALSAQGNDVLAPLPGLRCFEELGVFDREQAELAVVRLGVSRDPAVREQMRLDRPLEGSFAVNTHAAILRNSSCVLLSNNCLWIGVRPLAKHNQGC